MKLGFAVFIMLSMLIPFQDIFALEDIWFYDPTQPSTFCAPPLPPGIPSLSLLRGSPFFIGDDFGNTLDNFELQQTISFYHDLASAERTSISFILQIKDSSEQIVYVDWIEMFLESGYTSLAKLTWKTNNPDMYTAEAYQWKSIGMYSMTMMI